MCSEAAYFHARKAAIDTWITGHWKSLDSNPQGLFELFNFQIYCRVREELWEMAFAQIVNCNSKFWDFQGFFMGQSPDKPCWIACPKLTSWNSPPWGKNRPSFKDSMRLNHRTFHKDGMLPDNALWLNCAWAQRTVRTNCDKSLNGCFCRQPWKIERSCGRDELDLLVDLQQENTFSFPENF